MAYRVLLFFITFETNTRQSGLYQIKLISVSEEVKYLGNVAGTSVN